MVMPLYIARWGDSSISIVQAQDEEELFWLLDQEGNPYECNIKEYDGPFHITLELDVDYALESESPGTSILVKDVSNCKDDWRFRWLKQHGETGDDMYDEIVRFAFPHYASYLDVCSRSQLDLMEDQTNLTEADREKLCKESLRQDLECVENYKWERDDRP
jgi:hypothetical protein